MGGFFEVTPVLRLLAIRHQANDLKAVVGRAGILQAGGGGHGRWVGTAEIIARKGALVRPVTLKQT